MIDSQKLINDLTSYAWSIKDSDEVQEIVVELECIISKLKGNEYKDYNSCDTDKEDFI